jgi:hypothetical protein
VRSRLSPVLSRLGAMTLRHGTAAVGPLTVSGVHFLIALLLLRWLTAAEFGQFSFMLVVTALCISLTNGLLGAPLASIAHALPEGVQSELDTYFKSSLLLACCLVVAVSAIALLSLVPPAAAALFGLYAGTMSLRLIARTYAYTKGAVRAVVSSDCVYSFSILLGLFVLLTRDRIELSGVALAMVAGAVLALAPFGLSFLATMVRSVRVGSVRAYRSVWQSLTRWSVLGVVTTEMTINAHAYLVTFIRGPGAFALLAVGALFMRPFSLIATALPDQERPAMAQNIANGDPDRAMRIAREYLFIMVAVWIATIALAWTVLDVFPGFVVKKGFDVASVSTVVVLWALITAARGLRAPDAVLLQAAREFKSLASASVKSSVVALLSTLALLLLMGPVASLAGILFGDLVMLAMVFSSVRAWRSRAPVRALVAAAT